MFIRVLFCLMQMIPFYFSAIDIYNWLTVFYLRQEILYPERSDVVVYTRTYTV